MDKDEKGQFESLLKAEIESGEIENVEDLMYAKKALEDWVERGHDIIDQLKLGVMPPAKEIKAFTRSMEQEDAFIKRVINT